MTLPRFSLRLLLVVVAVLCAWLAWERSVVVRRRAAREALIHRFALIHPYNAGDPEPLGDRPVWPPTVPWFRRLLGDQPIDSITLPFNFPEAEVEAVSRQFPEAMIDRDPIEFEKVPTETEAL